MADGTKETILDEASRIVNGQRREDYGGPFESFSDIARGWSMVLGTEVTPEQVGLCMIQLKVARAKNGGFHRDSFVDIAGYAQCMEFVADHRALERAAEELGRLQHAHDDGRVCELRNAAAAPSGEWRIKSVPAFSALLPGEACSRAHDDTEKKEAGE